MDPVIDWLAENWMTVTVVLFWLDKVVKLTPTKYDDLNP